MTVIDFRTEVPTLEDVFLKLTGHLDSRLRLSDRCCADFCGLTWLEIKIFVREPMGVIGTVGIPVLVFVLLSRMMGPRVAENSPGVPRYVSVDLPIFASLMIAASAVLSLVAIIAIYREGGILKRLRATPLRPHTILTAHVLVKLLFTAVTLAVMVLVGPALLPHRRAGAARRRSRSRSSSARSASLSLGFLIASIVPTARFAQPIGTLIVYPMLGLSGLFVPIDALPPLLQVVARVLPLDLCGLAAARHLARRRVARPHRRRRDARGDCSWSSSRSRRGCSAGSDEVCAPGDPRHGLNYSIRVETVSKPTRCSSCPSWLLTTFHLRQSVARCACVHVSTGGPLRLVSATAAS